MAIVDGETPIRAGDHVGVEIAPRRMHLFESQRYSHRSDALDFSQKDM